ncbi:unnamed protein product [Caenorhabditis brenneri]
MRPNSFFFLIFLVLQCFGEETKTYKGIKATIGLYCPDKTNWKWNVAMYNMRVGGLIPKIEEYKSREGHATKNLQYFQLDSEDLQRYDDKIFFRYRVEHECTSDGNQTPLVFGMLTHLSTSKPSYNFLAVNLQSKTQDAEVYKKLFVEYLKNECPTGDCSSARELVDCSYHVDAKDVEQCKRGLEDAYKTHMAEFRDSKNPSSTDKDSNTKLFTIIGISSGVVLLIIGISVTVFCYRRKKKRSQSVSGTTGTQTGSGTTQQPTTTGTLQKTATGGTGTTATGRY